MARQIKKPVVYRRHEIDPSGTGVRCMDVAPIPEEAPSASANTGSPKLPTLEECTKEAQAFALYDLTYREYGVVRTVYDFICRQLRASA
jgi:hypothetical protein